MGSAAAAPLEVLAAGWFHQTVTLRCADAAALVDDPAFAGRLRGAFERALMVGASDESLGGAPCRWDPPCAYESQSASVSGRAPPVSPPPAPSGVRISRSAR